MSHAFLMLLSDYPVKIINKEEMGLINIERAKRTSI